MVIATQNPIELEGTFPLPEAQIDRFLLRVALGYPDEAEEHEILLRYEQSDPLADLAPVVEAGQLLTMRDAVCQIKLAEPVRNYLVNVARATRTNPAVDLGVSPRGTLALYRASQALAALRGRDYVIPDDVKYLAPAVLVHRLIISSETRLRGRTGTQIVRDIIEQVPIPVEEGV
jgi:MoxR-like ATPase